MVQMKNRISGLLMETGVSYNLQTEEQTHSADASVGRETGSSIQPRAGSGL